MSIRKSAALILVNAKSRKILFGRRSLSASFMPNALVFPGGVIDHEDASFPKERCSTTEQGTHNNFAGKVAAIRELFEECGLLPVLQSDNEKGILSASGSRNLSEWQSKLQHKESTFQKLFTENLNQFRLDLTGFYLSNWLTPFDYPRRYDNTFYAMEVDTLAIPRPYGCELLDAKWLLPTEVLRKAEDGGHIVPPPQAYELNRIIQADSKGIPLKKIIALLNGDQAYIEGEQSTVTPMRDIKESKFDKRKPVNRITYKKEPMFGNVKVYISL